MDEDRNIKAKKVTCLINIPSVSALARIWIPARGTDHRTAPRTRDTFALNSRLSLISALRLLFSQMISRRSGATETFNV